MVDLSPQTGGGQTQLMMLMAFPCLTESSKQNSKLEKKDEDAPFVIVCVDTTGSYNWVYVIYCCMWRYLMFSKDSFHVRLAMHL